MTTFSKKPILRRSTLRRFAEPLLQKITAKIEAASDFYRCARLIHASAAIVSVSDNGIGIPAKICRILGIFSQVRSHQKHAGGGLGIGLSLVRQLVGMHGGSVQAKSIDVRQGSTFIVRLPLADGP